jgi:hypothetical protein
MRTCFISLIFLISLNVIAQSADEKEVSAAVEVLRKALVDANESELRMITAEELSYGHSSGKIEDKKEFMERLITGNSDFITIQLSDQTIRVVDNIAIVRHKLVAEAMDNGKPTNPNLSVMLIFQKQKGKWKLLARQATKLPN